MIKSHLLIMLIASLLISVVIGFISKENAKERKKFIIIMFASLAGFCIVAAWIMYFIQG